MLTWKETTEVGRKLLTVRRLLLAGAVAAGLYTVGDGGASYLSTATRLATDSVNDYIPLEFELERAKTMIDSLVPDIKRNMIVIAKEEVAVEGIRDDVTSGEQSLKKQRDEMLRLREDAQHSNHSWRIGSRLATEEEVKQELQHRLAHYKLSEATLGAKQDLLANRVSSLGAARGKLEKMLHSKRDLEAQVENLHARLRMFQSKAVASTVNLDDTQVAKCQKLVDDLRVRLRVAERLVSTHGDVEEVATDISLNGEDVFAQIDECLQKSSPGTSVATGL